MLSQKSYADIVKRKEEPLSKDDLPKENLSENALVTVLVEVVEEIVDDVITSGSTLVAIVNTVVDEVSDEEQKATLDSALYTGSDAPPDAPSDAPSDAPPNTFPPIETTIDDYIVSTINIPYNNLIKLLKLQYALTIIENNCESWLDTNEQNKIQYINLNCSSIYDKNVEMKYSSFYTFSTTVFKNFDKIIYKNDIGRDEDYCVGLCLHMICKVYFTIDNNKITFYILADSFDIFYNNIIKYYNFNKEYIFALYMNCAFYTHVCDIGLIEKIVMPCYISVKNKQFKQYYIHHEVEDLLE